MARFDPEAAENRDIRRLYEAGKTGQEIAIALGMKKGTVYWRIQQLGLETRGGGGCPREHRQFREDGLISLTEVCRLSGGEWSRNRIRRMVEDAGIETRLDRAGRCLFIPKTEAEQLIAELEGRWALERCSWESAGIQPWEMGWLGGFWDGEGSVCLTFEEKEGRQKHTFCSIVAVGNTDYRLVSQVEGLFDRLKIRYHESMRNPDNPKWARSWHVCLVGVVARWRFCVEVAPFLVAKREAARLMQKFCEAQAANAGRPGLWKIAKEFARRMLEINSSSSAET